jgi:predicted cupin superfamily sugar epimerase
MVKSKSLYTDWEHRLDLKPHPEGGAFREIFRSATALDLTDGRRRKTLTHIYFLLKSGQVSLFHRVAQDEMWHLYDGRGLKLIVYRELDRKIEEILLGRQFGRFCAVVRAGAWQAAEPLETYALCGCSVAPGFESEDFELLHVNTSLGKYLVSIGYGRFVAPEMVAGRCSMPAP